MAENCATWPFIEGEPSQLYKDIFKYTGKNRKLTNLIYATAILDWFTSRFGSADYNSQHELRSSVVISELDVDSLINIDDLINNAKRDLGALTSTGEPRIYDSVDEIIDKVQNFNNQENSKAVALITRVSDGYIILVLPKDDTNFATAELYETGIKLLDAIIEKLADTGFHTLGLSNQSKLALNQLNAQYFTETLKLFQHFDDRRFYYMNANQASLLVDLMKGNTLLERMKSVFGDKTADVIKFLFSLKDMDELPEELEEFRERLNNKTWINGLFKGFKTTVSTEFSKISLSDLNAKLNGIYKRTVSTETKGIRAVLLDLYEKWNLDKDCTILSEDISSVENSILQMISRMLNNIAILKARGNLNPDLGSLMADKIKSIEAHLEKKEYAASILEFLLETVDLLKFFDTLDTSLVDDDLFDTVASQLLNVKQLVLFYRPIISALINIDNLEQRSDLETSDVNHIKELASRINNMMAVIENTMHRKEFGLVYKFLKLYWGEEDLKKFEGEGSFEISLLQALDTGTFSMNVFDRYISAMTEVVDPVLSTLGASIKDLHSIRDDMLKDLLIEIRRADNKLLEGGGSSKVMYEVASNGDVFLASEIDYDAFYKARREEYKRLKDSGTKGAALLRAMENWDRRNRTDKPYKVPGVRLINSITHTGLEGAEDGGEVILYGVPNEKYRKSMPTMNAAEQEYYKTMMSLKASYEYVLNLHGIETDLFVPILVSSELTDAVANCETAADAARMVRDNFVDKFKLREDDTLFGSLEVITDNNGNIIHQLPTFYVANRRRRLKDLRRVNRDFSKAMMSFATVAVNYDVMSKHLGILELTKDFLMDRPVTQSWGDKAMVVATDVLGKTTSRLVTKKSSETYIGGWLNDIYDSKIYGIKHMPSKSVLGGNINTSKAVDLATQYTSVTGLAMNVPGAIANALVGKLQMIIEAGGHEFFNFTDYTYASTKYWLMIPDVMKEMWSNNKSSDLGLLMEFFDVEDDVYRKMRESGFYNNAVSKIIGNTSLFFMYGLGEHLLHALTMLAVLHHTKIRKIGDTNDDSNLTVLDLFDKEVKDGNGKLKIKEGYEYYNRKTKKWYKVDAAFIRRQKKIVSYSNRSMHGAFGDDEKGTIHRYAFGRLVMNFRQWMPAHYYRRFNLLHWDALLEEWREGYYITCWKFAGTLCKDLAHAKFAWMTHWNELSDMLKANLKRAATEASILIFLALLSRWDYGGDPKHRNWALALLNYEIKRMLMETEASAPISVFDHGAFLTNMYKTFNEPIAAISSALRLTNIFGIDDLIFMRRIQSGPHEGELKYVRGLERAVPFYDLVYKWWNMDTDDSMFALFNISR